MTHIQSDSRFDRYLAETELLKKEGMYRSIPPIQGQGKWITLPNGKQPLLNLSSNDYLGLFEKPEWVREFLSGRENIRFSSASSRLLTGNSNPCLLLEQRLCQLFGKEAALLYNSGYHVNTGILPALCNKETLIIADKFVHASLIDGIKLAGCDFLRFRHNDSNHLEAILQKEYDRYQTIFLVTESLFSMGGDEAPLNELVEIRNRYPKLILYVDEAHAFGVYGEKGCGLTEKYGLLDQVDILVATFGKAIGSVGAFVVCNQTVRNYLVNKSRSLIFSTALPPVNVAWSDFILEKLPGLQPERAHLQQISTFIRNELGCGNGTSQIIPVVTGDPMQAVHLSRTLTEYGIYALPVRPPTVPISDSGIRLSLTASVTFPEAQQIIDTIKIIRSNTQLYAI